MTEKADNLRRPPPQQDTTESIDPAEQETEPVEAGYPRMEHNIVS